MKSGYGQEEPEEDREAAALQLVVADDEPDRSLLRGVDGHDGILACRRSDPWSTEADTIAGDRACGHRARSRGHPRPAASHAARSPVGPSGPDVFLKAELFQKTGSFKPRGMLNKVASLSEEEKARGIVTWSAGNAAQGAAFAAAEAGIDVHGLHVGDREPAESRGDSRLRRRGRSHRGQPSGGARPAARVRGGDRTNVRPSIRRSGAPGGARNAGPRGRRGPSRRRDDRRPRRRRRADRGRRIRRRLPRRGSRARGRADSDRRARGGRARSHRGRARSPTASMRRSRARARWPCAASASTRSCS